MHVILCNLNIKSISFPYKALNSYIIYANAFGRFLKFLNFDIGHAQVSIIVLLRDSFVIVRTQYQVLKQFGLLFRVTTFIYFQIGHTQGSTIVLLRDFHPQRAYQI